MKRKYNKMVALRPDGQTERWQVPIFLTAREIGGKLRHSVVFQFVPRGKSVWGYEDGKEHNTVRLSGPCWLLWDRGLNSFVRVSEPTDQEALRVVNKKRCR